MYKPQVCFWSHHLDNGCFSNWYDAPHKLDGIQFQNTEQSFMALKAATFDDYDSIQLIYDTPDPKAVKKLGRQIKGFDDKVWEKDREICMYIANFYKFTQSPTLLKKLFDTEGCELVEASPLDKIWGSGWDRETHVDNVGQKYPGLNLLGKVLSQLRDDLLGGFTDFDDSDLMSKLKLGD